MLSSPTVPRFNRILRVVAGAHVSIGRQLIVSESCYASWRVAQSRFELTQSKIKATWVCLLASCRYSIWARIPAAHVMLTVGGTSVVRVMPS